MNTFQMNTNPLPSINQINDDYFTAFEQKPSYHSSHKNSTLRKYRHVHSKVTYRLRVHQFTVQQVGKGRNNVIVIDQVIAHPQKLNPNNVQACQFKGNLLAESAPVHSIASGSQAGGEGQS